MKYKWGDLITLEYGKPVADKTSIDGLVPVYGTNGQIGKSHQEALCSHQSFILGRKGAYRGVHYSDRPFSVIDTAFFAENLVPDILMLKWAYYKFLTYDINGMDSGSAIPSTDRYTIYAIDVDIPPIDDQERIVCLLSSLDAQIANNRKINHHLEALAQAVFKSWFVDFEPFGGTMPKSWREGTISDLGEVVGGGTPSKAKPEYFTECGIAWITPKDLSINKSKFIAHGADDISELGLHNSSARIMPRGTVLFSSRAPIGYIAIASSKICTNQGFKSVMPKENIGSAYVYYFLIDNLQTIENMASGSTFKEISGGTMKGIPAIIPDNDILRRFHNVCGSILEKQEQLEIENVHLAALRDALLPKLMSGELSVEDVGDVK